MLISTDALIVYHDLGARMGVVTGQGLIGLIRQRFGVRTAGFALALLVVANLGTTCDTGTWVIVLPSSRRSIISAVPTNTLNVST